MTLGESSGLLKKSAVDFCVVYRGFGNFMLYMLALVGQPRLRGRDA